jgi:hypothetical protein
MYSGKIAVPPGGGGIYLFEFQPPMSKIFKFLKRDCGTIPVAEML